MVADIRAALRTFYDGEMTDRASRPVAPERVQRLEDFLSALSADPPLGPQDQRTLVYDTAAPMLITAGDNAKPNQVRGFARQDVC